MIPDPSPMATKMCRTGGIFCGPVGSKSPIPEFTEPHYISLQLIKNHELCLWSPNSTHNMDFS